jgi:hypothetical protein
MKPARLLSRVAIGGVAAALATAGLVGVTGTSASAAVVSTTYNCSAFGTNFPVGVTVDIALPTTGTAGLPVPAGLLSFNSTATIPGTVQAALDTPPIGPVTGGKSDDFGAAFGSTVAKAPVKWTKPPAADSNGNWVYTGKGANLAFPLPAAGTYAVTMPKAFTLQATRADGTTGATALCTSANPTSIGSITLGKQVSTTKAKGPKSAKVGSVVTLKVKVTDEFSSTGGPIPSGKLIVKDGKKKVGKGTLDSHGKAKIKVKGLKVGSHKLKVFYKGDSYNQTSKSKALKLTVKK